jgi:hypothetical protein
LGRRFLPSYWVIGLDPILLEALYTYPIFNYLVIRCQKTGAQKRRTAENRGAENGGTENGGAKTEYKNRVIKNGGSSASNALEITSP